MWIVMTATAHMPSSCWGRYGRVALVHVQPYVNPTANTWHPKQIKMQKGVTAIYDMGKHNMGTTDRCAFARALKLAGERAEQLNSAGETAQAELLMSWGGSA